jgi:hypothetical protein
MKALLFALFSALPPFAQSSREVQAILADPRAEQFLGSGQPIQTIERKGNGYEISTARSSIWVDILYSPAKRPGPIPFELEFHETR